MNRFAPSHTCGRSLVAAAVFTAFLWTLSLSVSPQLHVRIHADGNLPDHACAVTLIATGSYDHAAQPPLSSDPQFTPCLSQIATLSSTWVRPLFLSAHVFAHAPPCVLLIR